MLPPEAHECLKVMAQVWPHERNMKKFDMNETCFHPIQYKKRLMVWSALQMYYSERHQDYLLLRVIFVPLGENLGTDLTKKINEDGESTEVDHLVIIRSKESNVAKLFDECKQYTIWETLGYDELRFNKLEFGLVSQYQLLLREERSAELNRLGVQNTEADLKQRLPRLKFREDAMGRFLGFQAGDLLRVVTPSITVGHEISYRYVY